MRILQINKFYSPHAGGVETVTQQLAEGTVARGHQTRVLTCHHEVDPRTRTFCSGGVEVVRAASFGFLRHASVSPTFPFLYQSAVEWAEIAHFHASSPTPETAHFVFGVPDATPVVVTFHAEPGASSRWKHLRPIYTPVLRSLLHRADRITATAPANISHTDLLQDFEHKTEVIPLATEFPVDPPPDVERERRQQKLLGEDEKPVILFVGRLVYCKGLRYLLRAMQHVEAHLLVVGKGKMLENLQAKTHSLEISGKVRFEGYVPEEHLGDYYRAADLFVLPSIAPTEAFGIVQLEAMAHGLPVINTDLPTGVPFVSQDEKTGLTVPPKDPDALAAALNQLIDDKEYRHRLGRNAAKRATAFTKEKMVDQYETLYEEILS